MRPKRSPIGLTSSNLERVALAAGAEEAARVGDAREACYFPLTRSSDFERLQP